MNTSSAGGSHDCYVDLPSAAFADLVEGYLLCWANGEQGWAVGLLSHRPNPEDDLLALQYALEHGLPIVRLGAAELAALSEGSTVRTLAGRSRFLITVSDVEDQG